MLKRMIPLAVILFMTAPARAQSFYTGRLVDPKAVNLEAFGAKGDGIADDTQAIQMAIDRVQETTLQGIVFVPQGRYRVTRTIYVWPSIRLIGYGTTRPVFVLAPNTPGYQDKGAENYMVFFAGSRPGSMGGRGGPVPGAPPPGAAPSAAGRGAAPAGTVPAAAQAAAGQAAGRGGRGGQSGRPPDSSPGTFYSAMSNTRGSRWLAP